MMLMLTVTLPCLSQVKPLYGVKLGYNASEVSTASNTKMRPLGGICIGVYADLAVIKRIHFQPEILYSVQGSRSYHTDPQTGESAGQSTLVIKYLNLPMVFKIYFGERFNFQVGAQVGRLISAVNKGVAFLPKKLGTTSPNLMSIDYSLVLGAGYHFARHYNAGIRFNYGVSSIYKPTGSTEVDNAYSNRVGNVYLAYTF